MPSAKKKRAKQRKAKATAAMCVGEYPDMPADLAQLRMEVDGYKHTYNKLRPKEVVAKVGRGEYLATLATFDLSPRSDADKKIMQLLSTSGLVQLLMDMLNRCENKCMIDVTAGTKGDLYLPGVWVGILSNFLCMDPLQTENIMQSIRPFINCICNFKKREIYKSNTNWYLSILPFHSCISYEQRGS